MDKMIKNDTFYMGVATAAPQIEGGWNQDGKGESVWDDYSKRGLIKNGQTCFEACDSYNRLDEDLALIKELGINSYRFSLSWPRIQPGGNGSVNPKGIEYYDRLIDGLLNIGVKPLVTLFHWDMPVELDRKGGFLDRSIVERFEEYARIVAEHFSDRVELFSVFNEALAVIDFLYIRPVGGGWEAKQPREVFEAIHNLLLCNGAATRALREYARGPVKVGMVNCTDIKMPKAPEFTELARKATFGLGEGFFGNNTLFYDPLVFGKYDERIFAAFGVTPDFIRPGDMDVIACKPDFLGLNVYVGKTVEPGENGEPEICVPDQNAVYGDMGWDIKGSASAVYYAIKFMSERYSLPVAITENGVSLPDWVDTDGNVLDYARADYIRRYAAGALRAKEEGLPVFGYYVWTLMDNFEWSSGYTRRFGLVYSDFVNKKRIKKQSFYFYKQFVKETLEKFNR